MRLRFHDKPCGTILGDVFPRATAMDLSQLNLRNKAFWNPPVTRTTDASGAVTTLQQLNAYNEAFWRSKS
jgi:hypothetical protein